MMTIHLLLQWFSLSDPLIEEILIDTPWFHRFAGNCFAEAIGYDMIEDPIPDETTNALEQEEGE